MARKQDQQCRAVALPLPAEISTLADDDEQCSSLWKFDNKLGAKSIQDAIIDEQGCEYCRTVCMVRI